MTNLEKRRAIKEAIGKRQSVYLVYKGKEREVNPYVIGVLNTGNEGVRVFEDKFKLFLLEKIESLEILNTKFKKSKEYNPKDRDFKKIYKRV